MTTLLRALWTISWIILIWAIMLMSPKWGLWFWIGWAGWNNEYGSKKSIEYTLKRVALVCAVITVLTFLALPYTTLKTTTTETASWSSLLNNLQQNTSTWAAENTWNTVSTWTNSSWSTNLSWTVATWNSGTWN